MPSRYYVVQERPSLTTGEWRDYINMPWPAWDYVGFDEASVTNQFFRIRAYRPLLP